MPCTSSGLITPLGASAFSVCCLGGGGMVGSAGGFFAAAAGSASRSTLTAASRACVRSVLSSSIVGGFGTCFSRWM